MLNTLENSYKHYDITLKTNTRLLVLQETQFKILFNAKTSLPITVYKDKSCSSL